jgi:hypothetical protein
MDSEVNMIGPGAQLEIAIEAARKLETTPIEHVE